MYQNPLSNQHSLSAYNQFIRDAEILKFRKISAYERVLLHQI